MSSNKDSYAAADDDDNPCRARARLEPDYKSLIMTLDTLKKDRAIVIVRTSIALNSFDSTLPRHRCSFAFFCDTTESVRTLVAHTRQYCKYLHEYNAQCDRRKRPCHNPSNTDRESCNCYGDSSCTIVSNAKQWLFTNHNDNTPLLPMNPRDDEDEWFTRISTCASKIYDSVTNAYDNNTHDNNISIDTVRRMIPINNRLEYSGNDAFFDTSVNSAISNNMLHVRTITNDTAVENDVYAVNSTDLVHMYKGITHMSLLCGVTIDSLIESLEKSCGGEFSVSCADGDVGECVCCTDEKDFDMCSRCNVIARQELTELSSKFRDDIKCTNRRGCTCISDAIIEHSTAHVIEIDAIPRTDDLAYIVMGDSVYSGESPLAMSARAAKEILGYKLRIYHYPYAIGQKQMKIIRKKGATTHGGYPLTLDYDTMLKEAQIQCRCADAQTFAHIAVHCLNMDESKQNKFASNTFPTVSECIEMFNWLPPFACALLTPYCTRTEEYAKLLNVARRALRTTDSSEIRSDIDFERIVFAEFRYTDNKRISIARALSFVKDPTDCCHFANVASSLLILFATVRLAHRACETISKRKRQEFLDMLSQESVSKKKLNAKNAAKKQRIEAKKRAEMRQEQYRLQKEAKKKRKDKHIEEMKCKQAKRDRKRTNRTNLKRIARKNALLNEASEKQSVPTATTNYNNSNNNNSTTSLSSHSVVSTKDDQLCETVDLVSDIEFLHQLVTYDIDPPTLPLASDYSSLSMVPYGSTIDHKLPPLTWANLTFNACPFFLGFSLCAT